MIDEKEYQIVGRKMKKFEYKKEYVPRYYHGRGREEGDPSADCLEKAGSEGWLLCAVGSPDTSGTVIMYFCKEI